MKSREEKRREEKTRAEKRREYKTGEEKRISTWTDLKYINPVSRAGGKRCTNVEARGSQARGG